MSGSRYLVNIILSQGHKYGVHVEGLRHTGNISGYLALYRRPSGVMVVFLEFEKESNRQNGHSWMSVDT
jgi:hypothetical protein